jgi:hypothetical protein
MKLELARGGGVAGLQRPPLVVDTAALPDAARGPLEALAARVLALPAPRVAEVADQVGYALTITDDRGAAHTIDFALGSAPPELKALVGELRRAAR